MGVSGQRHTLAALHKR